MTVSFFTKQSKTRAEGIRNALIYGASIIFIYTGLGLLLTAVFGVDVLNLISTDPYFNLFLFLLLIVFGVSFLGAFEIQLPTSWANKVDAQADRGGLIGIFFMALHWPLCRSRAPVHWWAVHWPVPRRAPSPHPRP